MDDPTQTLHFPTYVSSLLSQRSSSPGYTHHPNVKTEYCGGGLIFTIVLISVVVYPLAFARLFERHKLTRFGLRFDDWLVIFSLIGLTAMFVISLVAIVTSGLGHHASDLPLESIFQSVLLGQVFGLVGLLTVLLVRISVLILIRRIFCDKQIAPVGRKIANILITLSIVHWIITECLWIFRCTPAGITFNVAKSVYAKCLDAHIMGYVTGGVSLALDIAILALPSYYVPKLQIPRQDRLRIGSVFLIGTFACICGALRFMYISRFVYIDATWSYPAVMIWTCLEAASGLVLTSVSVFSRRISDWSACLAERPKNLVSTSVKGTDNVSHSSEILHMKPFEDQRYENTIIVDQTRNDTIRSPVIPEFSPVHLREGC